MAVRLGVASLLLERAAERVVRVVVRRRELEHRPELRLRLLPALDPEVRDPERLADRRLVRLELLRLLERDGRLRGHAVLQVGPALLEEVIRVGHRSLRYGKVLLQDVERRRQVARGADLDPRTSLSRVDRC